EGSGKLKKLYEDTSNLIEAFFGYFIFFMLLFLLLNYLLEDNSDRLLLLSLVGVIIKFAMASYVMSKAKRQNRNVFLWYVLGFLEFHSALIALSFGKTIYSIPKRFKPEFLNLNKRTKEKATALKELKGNKRDPNEFEIPLKKIISQY